MLYITENTEGVVIIQMNTASSNLKCKYWVFKFPPSVVKKSYPKIRVAPPKNADQNLTYSDYSFNKLIWLGLEVLILMNLAVC